MEQLIDFTIKAFYAAALGFILGIQREKIGKPAGTRTYSLVALGAAVFTYISATGFQGFGGTNVITAIASNIVVGIGFLGAGIIIFHDDRITGLTTAAGLWATAALGMLVGIGRYLEAAVLTLIILLILFSAELQRKEGWLKK